MSLSLSVLTLSDRIMYQEGRDQDFLQKFIIIVHLSRPLA